MKLPDEEKRKQKKRGRVRVDREVASVAHPTRQGILNALQDGPRTTNQLEEELEESRYNLYHHLAVLKDEGFIDEEKDGRTKVFSLKEKEVTESLQRNIEEMSRLSQQTVMSTQLEDLKGLQGAEVVPSNPSFSVDLQEAPTAEKQSILGSLNRMLSKKGKKRLSDKKRYRVSIQELNDDL